MLLATLGLVGLVWYGAPPTDRVLSVAVPLELVDETVLSPLAGAVLVRSAGRSVWAPAVAGQPLTVGDAVRTEPGAHALITFFEGSTAVLEPDAELVVGRLDRDVGDL